MSKLKSVLKECANTLSVFGGIIVAAVCFSRIFLGEYNTELSILDFIALFFAACCAVTWICTTFSDDINSMEDMEDKNEQ